MKASICAPSARCTGSWPRTSRCESGAISAVIPATPSPSWWPRAPTRPGPGHHPAPGAQTLDVLLPLCLARHLQPLRRGLDGCRSGERRARRDADRGNLSQARHRAPGAHPAFGPRRADDQQATAQLLADLGVTRSLSRPQVSDDNPFSEAQFKTLKYHPGFPGRFEDITAAIAFCRSFFPWYNTEHRHAGIAMLTPDDVHHHRHRMCWLSADVPCKPPGPFTPNASSTAPRNPPRFPKPSGSTHPPLPQQEKRVSK